MNGVSLKYSSPNQPITQVFSTLAEFDNVCAAIFDRISSLVDKQHTRLTSANKRTTEARTRIEKIKQFADKPLVMKSANRYPDIPSAQFQDTVATKNIANLSNYKLENTPKEKQTIASKKPNNVEPRKSVCSYCIWENDEQDVIPVAGFIKKKKTGTKKKQPLAALLEDAPVSLVGGNNVYQSSSNNALNHSAKIAKPFTPFAKGAPELHLPSNLLPQVDTSHWELPMFDDFERLLPRVEEQDGTTIVVPQVVLQPTPVPIAVQPVVVVQQARPIEQVSNQALVRQPVNLQPMIAPSEIVAPKPVPVTLPVPVTRETPKPRIATTAEGDVFSEIVNFNKSKLRPAKPQDELVAANATTVAPPTLPSTMSNYDVIRNRVEQIRDAVADEDDDDTASTVSAFE